MNNNFFLRLMWMWAAFTAVTVAVAQEAKINGTEYATLSEAITQSTGNDVITLLEDIDNSDYSNGHTAIRYSLKPGTTLDGDNHQISGDVCIYINAGGGAIKNVNFQNIHNTTVIDASGYGLSKNKIGSLSAVYSEGLTGTAEITGCTFNNIDWDAIQITPKAGAVIKITDNIFKHTDASTSQIRYAHIEPGSKTIFGEITITDNQFYKSASNDIEAVGAYYISKETSTKNFSGNYVEDTGHLLLEVWESSLASSVYPFSTFWPMRSEPTVDEDNLILNVYDDKKNTYGSLAEAIEKIEKKNTPIYINQDNNEEITIPEGKSFYLYDEGHKITGNITNKGELTIAYGAAIGHSAHITNHGTLNLRGSNSTTLIIVNKGTLNIESGLTYDVKNITNEGKVNIKGGSFTTKPEDDWIIEWYIANQQDDGTWKIGKMNITQAIEHGAVASSSKTSGTYYKSLQEAALDEKTPAVHLQTDITEDIKDIKSSASYYALYLNSHSFKGSLEMPNDIENIKIYGDNNDKSSAEITKISGNTLTVGFSTKSYAAHVTIKNANLENIITEAYGTTVIDGGYYGKAEVKIKYANQSAESPESTGNLIINGGTFESDKVKVTYTNHTPSSEEKDLSEYVSDGNTVIQQTLDGKTVYTVMPDTENKNVLIIYDNGTAEYLQATGNKINLKDDGVKKVAIENDVDDADVVYTRKFTGTNIEAWYVPFNMEITAELAQDFQFGKIFSLEVDDITGKATDVVCKSLGSGDMLKANTPYFVQLKSEGRLTDGEYNAEFTGKELKKTVATDNVWCATTELKYTFMGSYESFVLKEKPYYALDNSGSFAYSDTDYELPPYRFYMFISDKETGTTIDPRTDANGVRRLKVISSDGNGGTTGIRIDGYGDILPESSSDCRIYDLTGRRVQNARKGIYIIDGKKMIFK